MPAILRSRNSWQMKAMPGTRVLNKYIESDALAVALSVSVHLFYISNLFQKACLKDVDFTNHCIVQIAFYHDYH